MYKKLLSDTLIYGLGAILPRIITFLLNPFYIDQIKDAEKYSPLVHLYAIIAAVNILLTFGMETAFFRYASEKDSPEKVFSNAFWFLGINGSIFLLLIWIFTPEIASFLDYSAHPEYVRWFALIAFFDAMIVIPLAWLRFQGRPILFSGIRIATITVQMILVILMFLAISPDSLANWGLTEKVSYPFMANLLASIFAFALISPLLKNLKFEIDLGLLKKMMRYAYPIMLAGLAFVINENFDKMVQPNFISKAEAGAYGGVYKLAVVMVLMVTAYRLGIEPFLFKQMHEKNAKSTYAQIMEYFVLFGSVASLGLVVNLGWLKTLLVPDESFWFALPIVPIVVYANLFFGIYYNLSTWYKVTDKTHVGTIISWIGAGITILLHLWLLPKYGFMVSAWATLAAYGSVMVISYFWGQKAYPIPYKTRKMVLYVGLSITLAFLSFWGLNQNFWWGNLLFILFAIFVWIIEKKSLALKR